MAVTIVATAGSATANSFVTLAEANTFMEGRLNASTWETDASDDNKNRALVEATRQLSAMQWLGLRTDTTQILSWPRTWVTNPDSPSLAFYTTTIIPQRVKDATMELAFQFIKAGTVDVAALAGTAGIKRKKVDVLETEYDTARRPTGLALYPSVTRYIRPLLSEVGPYSSTIVRG
jgi:hypothetical protein